MWKADLIQALAVMDSIRLDGSECEIGLKVKNDLQGCRKFLGHLLPDGKYLALLATIKPMYADEAFLLEHVVEFKRIEVMMGDILRCQEFALERIRTKDD